MNKVTTFHIENKEVFKEPKMELNGLNVFEEVWKECLFFVDKETNKVLYKIELKCDMNGNEGFVDQIDYISY